MKLPIGLSVPHAGLYVPRGLEPQCLLTPEQVAADGDVGAAAIYSLATHVSKFVSTTIARAVLDLNRAADDIRKDGVIKTHTCWDEPIWRVPPSPEQVGMLMAAFWSPYHGNLGRWAGQVKLAVDCHTMAERGPPVGPDAGKRRPLVCLGDGDGASCPRHWVEALQRCFVAHFGDDVTINEPFAGGYITRQHGGPAQPWVQIELSRTDAVSVADKQKGVLRALTDWCRLEL